MLRVEVLQCLYREILELLCFGDFPGLLFPPFPEGNECCFFFAILAQRLIQSKVTSRPHRGACINKTPLT